MHRVESAHLFIVSSPMQSAENIKNKNQDHMWQLFLMLLERGAIFENVLGRFHTGAKLLALIRII
jgi:hypothetical protein